MTVRYKPAIPTKLRVTLDRIKTLLALGRVAEARKELEPLSRQTNLGDLRGQVHLLLGDVLIASGEIDAGRQLVRQARSSYYPRPSRPMRPRCWPTSWTRQSRPWKTP